MDSMRHAQSVNIALPQIHFTNYPTLLPLPFPSCLSTNSIVIKIHPDSASVFGTHQCLFRSKQRRKIGTLPAGHRGSSGVEGGYCVCTAAFARPSFCRLSVRPMDPAAKNYIAGRKRSLGIFPTPCYCHFLVVVAIGKR